MKRALKLTSYLDWLLQGFLCIFKKCLPFALLAMAVTYFLSYAAGNVLAACDNPVLPDTTWEQIGNPDAAGWSAEKLQEACEYAQTIDTAAVVLIYRGKILYHWGQIDQKYQAHSIRKAFLSALYGIHVDEGNIDLSKTMLELGINDYPNPLTAIEKTATVRMLLQSRSGIYIEAACESQEMQDTRPPRGSHPPGTFFYYNNWDFNAAGTVFQQEAGVTIHAEFQNRIAVPIGMEDFVSGDVIYVFEPVSIHPCYKFRMTALDMARFGLLYLRNGLWGQNRIISQEWIDESTTAYSDLGEMGGFGYMWEVSIDGKPGDLIQDDFYWKSGTGGHMVLIVPAMDFVLVHRVDTDIGDSITGQEWSTLISMILDARKNPILPGVILLLN
jgi:CubicO group peptidase (beta-lactamase class C family)